MDIQSIHLKTQTRRLCYFMSKQYSITLLRPASIENIYHEFRLAHASLKLAKEG